MDLVNPLVPIAAKQLLSGSVTCIYIMVKQKQERGETER
jgi:hypothetical protein